MITGHEPSINNNCHNHCTKYQQALLTVIHPYQNYKPYGSPSTPFRRTRLQCTVRPCHRRRHIRRESHVPQREGLHCSATDALILPGQRYPTESFHQQKAQPLHLLGKIAYKNGGWKMIVNG